MNMHVLFLLAAALLVPQSAGAEQGPVVALFEIEDKGAGVPAEELSRLTDFLGARLAEGGFRMVPREEVRKRLAGQKKESYRSCYDRSCQIELGRELAAQKSLAVRILAIGQSCQVTAELFDLGQSATELAATEETACGVQGLLAALGRVADRLCRPPGPEARPRAAGMIKNLPPGPVPARRAREPRIRISSEPAGAALTVDRRKRCQATPCSLDLKEGEYEIAMKAAKHLERREKVRLLAGQELHWKLEPLPYSYLGMDHATVVANLFEVGMDPSDSGYLVFTLIDGASFFQLHPVVDVGMAVQSFAFRYTPDGSRWSLFSFGPAFRTGRLVVKAHLQMLSFLGGSWTPGLSLRASIPLLSERHMGDWSVVIPMPSVGLDVHLDDSLGYDETRFWVGFGWIGGVTFD